MSWLVFVAISAASSPREKHHQTLAALPGAIFKVFAFGVTREFPSVNQPLLELADLVGTGHAMANPDEEMDDFDFGGDEPEEQKPLRGVKRDYEDFPEADEDEEIFPAKQDLTAEESTATTTILNLRSSLEEQSATIAALQGRLASANEERDSWLRAFQGGPLVPPDTKPEAALVLEAISKLFATDARVKEELRYMKRRENTMLLKLEARDSKVAELESSIKELQQLLTYPVLRNGKLLLDPVVHAEFTHLKEQAEAAEKARQNLQDALTAQQFTPNSKSGKALMKKCKQLQEENEEIGLQASEGKLHDMENKLLLQKDLHEEMRKGYDELQDCVDEMNEEAEKVQANMYDLQRQLKQREQEVASLRQQLDDLLAERWRAQQQYHQQASFPPSFLTGSGGREGAGGGGEKGYQSGANEIRVGGGGGGGREVGGNGRHQVLTNEREGEVVRGRGVAYRKGRRRRGTRNERGRRECRETRLIHERRRMRRHCLRKEVGASRERKRRIRGRKTSSKRKTLGGRRTLTRKILTKMTERKRKRRGRGREGKRRQRYRQSRRSSKR
eukprot:TRINITY_DN2545_c0_g2_i2.p1 TRINITY_DN2545_c0_g2~~TRINITY_DN2545_c0_g2_i2.p1  ORF type:complete len:560 (-),score=141.09 TRINITY_DN2545_c0_g2_i2:634-2313(-)